MPPPPDVQELLILEPDPVHGEIISRLVGATFPDAHVHLETEPARAAIVLAEREIGLFIVALRGFDLDVITLLGVWAGHEVARTPVLVVTPDANSSAVLALRGLPISGVFDASTEDVRELEFACRVVAAGARYCSRRIREQFATPIASAKAGLAVASRIRARRRPTACGSPVRRRTGRDRPWRN